MSLADANKLNEQLSAYADGELRGREKDAVEALLKTNEAARRRLDELRRVAALVASLPRHRAPESILADVTAAAERSELLGDAPAPAAGRRPRWGWLAAAAALALLVTSGAWWLRRPVGVGLPPSTLAARNRTEDIGRDPRMDANPRERPASAGDSRGFAESAPESEESGPDKGEMILSPLGSGRAKSIAGETVTGLRDRSAKMSSLGYVGDEDLEPVGGRADAAIDSSLATLDQKLAAGAGELERHPFANETFQLSAAFPDARARDAAVRSLLATLKREGGRELGAGAGPAVDESVYMRGRAGVNFRAAAADEKQIIIHLPHSRLAEILDQLGQAVEAPGDVVLAAGPIQAVGAERIRSLVDARSRALDATEQRHELVMRDPVRSDGPPASPAEEAIRTLARVLTPAEGANEERPGELTPPTAGGKAEIAAGGKAEIAAGSTVRAADAATAAASKPTDSAKDDQPASDFYVADIANDADLTLTAADRADAASGAAAVDAAAPGAAATAPGDAGAAPGAAAAAAPGAPVGNTAAPARGDADDSLAHRSLAKRRLEELRRRRAAETAALPPAPEPAPTPESPTAATEPPDALFGAPAFPSDPAAIGPPMLESKPKEPLVTFVVRLAVKSRGETQN